MKKYLLVLLCAMCLVGNVQARKRKKKSKPVAAAKSVAKTTKGLFTVTKDGEKYFFSIPDSIVGREILATVRFTGTPAGVGKYAGEEVTEQTLYFEKRGKDQLLLRTKLLVNQADTLDMISKAVSISNVNPIIGAFKVKSSAGKMNKIDVTSFFSGDCAALNLPKYYRSKWGILSQIGSLSYIDTIMTFPMNTEVQMVKTYATSTKGSIAGMLTQRMTIGTNVSFVLLPKKPMARRLFDPRVGFFTDEYVHYSDHQQRVRDKRFITRWRLEPKNKEDEEKMKKGILVEPKKPIIYYIDPATPKQWRKYLIAGVNDWQKAFEAAGFKNAIMAKEWPDSAKDMSMYDARFSVIRYLASPIPNAYGPNVHDPRSGEILESHVCWYHNVMKLVHDWYMVQAGTLDEAAQSMRFTPELMGQLIRFVSSHEIGHTLGLRHNFGSSSTVPVDSLRNKAWVEAHGHTPSIMDYARFNYVAQPEDGIGAKGIFPRIGDYDVWAIKWGYTPMWKAYDEYSDHLELEKLVEEEYKKYPATNTIGKMSRIWFGDGETNTTRDSRCQTEDLGDDAVKASHYGVLNLQRELKQLPEWTYQRDDIFSKNIKEMYDQIVQQYFRYMRHVMYNIGGVYKNYGTVDEGGNTYMNVSKARQKECLEYLRKNVLEEPTWLIDQPYVKSFGVDPQATTMYEGKVLVMLMSNTSMLKGLNAEYPAVDYLHDLSEMIFKANPNRYERGLQEIFVNTLIKDFQFTEAYPGADFRPAVLYTLKQLQKKLARSGGNRVLAAHYASLEDRIARALAVK